MQQSLLLAGLCAATLMAQQALAQAPDLSLARLECGTPAAPTAVNQRFPDTYADGDLTIQHVFSCYLVKHGNDDMLRDTGHAMPTPNVSLVDQLVKLDLEPEQINYVGSKPTVIIQHDARDVDKLPAFPAAAK